MKHANGFLRLILVVLTCLVGSHVIADEDQKEPSILQELQLAITSVVEVKEIPAVSIAMVDESGPVWVGAIGKANLENDPFTRLGAPTVYSIGVIGLRTWL